MATQNYNTLKNSSVLVPATSSDLGTISQPYGNLYLAGNLTLGGGAGTITATSTVVPKISGLTYANGATAANPTGGETITINGSGFLSGLNVYVNNLQVASASQVSVTQATFVSPVNAAGNYPLAVVNTDGGSATFVAGMTYSNVPIWTTSAGSLGTFQEGNTVANTIAATDGALSITYSITSGSLPGGLSLGSANGNITGTLSNVTSGTNVTYNFTVGAADPANQVVTRNFSYVVSGDTVSFSSPTSGGTYTLAPCVAMSNISVSATSTFGRSITYNAVCLPTGVSLSGGNITGTPTVLGSKTAKIYANTNTKSSNISVTFNVTSPFLSATGGTITTATCYKYHTFTANGTFTVNGGSSHPVCYIIVGGGGGGGAGGRGGCYFFTGGGGGSGGVVAVSCATLSCTSFPIVIGLGGSGGHGRFASPAYTRPSNGGDSTFNGKTAYGGGYGASWNCGTVYSAQNGGSGGGPGIGQSCGHSSYVYGPGSGTQSSSASGGYGNNGSSSSNSGGTANYTWVDGVTYGGSAGIGVGGAGFGYGGNGCVGGTGTAGTVIIRYKYK